MSCNVSTNTPPPKILLCYLFTLGETLSGYLCKTARDPAHMEQTVLNYVERLKSLTLVSLNN